MESIKTELRRAMRARRAALDAAATRLAGLRVVEQLAGFVPYLSAGLVVAYCPVGNEVPTEALLADARRRGKRVFVPRADEGWFFELEPEATLARGSAGALEPLPGRGLTPGEGPGVAFVPLLAWDGAGGRLGRGGGWYDRTLPRLRMPIIGVGYDFQERVQVPIEPWDVQLDYVVTESRLIQCGTVPSVGRLT